MKDYYKILEIDNNASQDEIKKAYRKLAMKYHPDKNQSPESEAKFKDIAESYEVLSNPNKRSKYDQYGSVDGNDFTNNYNMEDFFSNFFGGAFNQRYNKQKKGSDLRIKVSVTLDDIIHGVKRKIKYKRNKICNPCKGEGGSNKKTCNACNGKGKSYHRQNTAFGQVVQESLCGSCNGQGSIIVDKCEICYGSGLVLKEEDIEIDLPVGLRHSMQLNMSNQGHEIPNGISGDLLILIEEIQDKLFKRNGSNLHYEYDLNVIDAIIGKKEVLNTPTGKIEINIKPGISPYETLSFKNMGVPDIERGIGDLILKIKVNIPKKLSKEEIEILKTLKDKENFNF